MAIAERSRQRLLLSWRLPTLRLHHLWWLLTLGGAWIGPASLPMGGGDGWWALRSGAWIVQTRSLPIPDPFTAAPQILPQYDGQWLAQALLYGLWRMGGLELVVLGNALAVTLALAEVLATCVIATGRLRLSCGLLLVTYAFSMTSMSVRAQTLAFPVFGFFLLAMACAEWRKERRLLWLLPAIEVVWANLHGSFFLGPLLLGCWTLGTVISRLSVRAALPYGAVLVTCLVAACLTPSGVDTFASALQVSLNPIARADDLEWAPTLPSSYEGLLLFGSFAVLGVGALLSPARIRAHLGHWLAVLGLGALAVSSLRAVVWYGLAVTPLLVQLGTPLADRMASRVGTSQARELPWLNRALAIGLVLLVTFSLPWFKASNPILAGRERPLVGADLPVGGADFLREHGPGGILFSDQIWCGYLDWAVWPAYRPLIDGHLEIHPPRVYLDYLDIQSGQPGWSSLLDSYGVSTLLVSPTDDAKLVSLLEASPAWQRVYQDAVSVVFVRAGAQATASTGVADAA